MSIISYYDHMQDKHIPTHGPGAWHDPDMVCVVCVKDHELKFYRSQ